MAQLGARFHGMEEVVSSNLTRSTKTFQTLTVPLLAKHVVTGVQLESKPHLMHGQPWAPRGFRCCPRIGLHHQCDRRNGHRGHRFSRLLSAGDDNKYFPYKDVAQQPDRLREYTRPLSVCGMRPDSWREGPSARHRLQQEDLWPAWVHFHESGVMRPSGAGKRVAGLKPTSRC